jgi:hypothetical protein
MFEYIYTEKYTLYNNLEALAMVSVSIHCWRRASNFSCANSCQNAKLCFALEFSVAALALQWPLTIPSNTIRTDLCISLSMLQILE